MEEKFNEGESVFIVNTDGDITKGKYMYQCNRTGDVFLIKTGVYEVYVNNVFATELEAIQWLKDKAQRNEDEYNARITNGNDHN